jgi:Na+-translocating ferredoxin:NAD+ oxidoreductase subunit G
MIWQSLRTNSLRLLAFALVAGLLVGTVVKLTKEPRDQQRRAAESQALNETVPPALRDEDLLAHRIALTESQWRALGEPSLRYVHLARRQGQITAFVVPVRSREGYSGDIQLLVGIDRQGQLLAARVTEHKETPGLGDKIDIKRHPWISVFVGKSLDSPQPSGWAVKKDGGVFDQFAGATITPRATVAAIRNALEQFQQQNADWQQRLQQAPTGVTP